MTGTTDKIRQTAYDFLRMISCISVVILHTAAIYLKEDFAVLVTKTDYNAASFWRVITQLAVPSFVMLSGAFNIKEDNGDFKLFYALWHFHSNIFMSYIGIMYLYFYSIQ